MTPVTSRPGMPGGQHWLLHGVLLGVIFVAALYLRSPKLLLEPRMWAEEGRYYYDALQDGNLSRLLLVVRGNYQLLLNMSVALAIAVPAIWAAHVTTFVAAAVAVVNMILLGRLASERGWHPFWTAMTAVTIALLPPGYELYLTSTNLQWLCCVSMLLIALCRLEDWSRAGLVAVSAWTILSGLTGPPSSMLAPVLLAVGWMGRSRRHLLIGGVLVACAVAQLAVIASHRLEGRSFAFHPYLMSLAPLLQSVLVPVAGTTLSQAIVDQLRGPGDIRLGVAIVVISASFLALWGRQVWRMAGGATMVVSLFGAAVLTSALNVFGAIGPAADLISVSDGARYFYLSTICWLVVALIILHRAGFVWRVTAVAFIGACLVTGVLETGRERWRGFIDSGISWRNSVDACRDRRPCRVQAWPVDPMWTFTLRRP